ncbi:U-box domain-containing protein 4 [Euphorbia peplus]|nr:U-box domain-containing protein 4 [Euphorbia peplus]
MEITLLKALLHNISSFLHFSSIENLRSELVQKYYCKAEEILKLLKPILDAIVDSDITSDEVLNKTFDELGQSVDELREILEIWQPLSSKLHFVLQNESLISKIRTSSFDVLKLLKSSDECLPEELSSSSLEYCTQKIKQMGYEQTSSVVREAIRDQEECVGPSSEILVKIAESLSLRSNQEILIEAVALEKLKENAEQDEKTREAELFDQMISLVTRMHDRLVLLKQSQTSSPVPIPADFCCPLSLELMTDPVIVSSGQTYEKAFIKNWIDLGLTVCPKTRQTLAHTNLIPNYTVKALIANWCESNNVKLPDPVKSIGLSQPHSSRNQPMSPESTRSTGSPGRNRISSSGMYREGTSPLHPRSTSEGSLSGIVGNEQGLDMTRMSLTSSDERSGSLEESNMDSVVHYSVSPSRAEVSNAGRANELATRNHSRNTSASSQVVNANQGDATESSELSNHLTSYSSDNSGEVKGEANVSSGVNTPHREPEYSPRLMEAWSRSQTIRRRPSDRLVPRIVSSAATETRADLSGVETQVRKLIEDLRTDSLDTLRTSTSELRLLAKHNMDNRIVIANSGAITILVNLLRSTDSRIQENAVTALLNLSINDNNKTAIASADAIEPLIYVLETGSSEAKENAAATLFSLSVIEDNKVRIGRSGAIGPLVDLLGNGTPRGKKDAATALFNLSIFHENKARIVQAGAVKYLVELMDPAAGMVDKAVAVLANLATIPEGRTAIGQEGGIPVLVEVVELGSARGKENAAAALLQLCTNSSRFCNTVLQEGAVPPLVALSQSGTPRAKEKAQALLQYFRNQRHGNARG